jgi:hypothetical protein
MLLVVIIGLMRENMRFTFEHFCQHGRSAILGMAIIMTKASEKT